jgi:hypothetical protein
MPGDKPKRPPRHDETPHTDDLLAASLRVSERYPDCFDDFQLALIHRDRTGYQMLGTFMELAKLDHPYETKNGTFRVSISGNLRTLYNDDRKTAVLLPDGEVRCVDKGDAYADLAYNLANWIWLLREQADAVVAHEFVSNWTKVVGAAVDAGEILIYEGEHRGETTVGKFVVSQNGAGKEVSVCIPLLAISGFGSLTDGQLPLNRARSFEERVLFHFLRKATAVSPPALVAAVAQRPARTL